MSNSFLLFLSSDIGALLLLGAFTTVMPPVVRAVGTTLLSGLGTGCCLVGLLLRLPAAGLTIPIGPPGLSMRFLLDPLSLFFLVIVLLAGTIVGAVQTAGAEAPEISSVRATALCLAGAALSLLAADGVAVATGLTIACGAALPPRGGHKLLGLMLVPLLVLTALCLLTPPGDPPDFDAIRTAPADPDRAVAACVLTLVAAAILGRSGRHQRNSTRDTMTSCVLLPLGSYLILRVMADLSGAAVQSWWGFILLLAGGSAAVLQGWRSATHHEIDGAVAALVRHQSGLVMAGIGLAFIARAADLPEAAGSALEATCLTVIGTGLAGTLSILSADAIGTSAGTYRLSRLGSLGQTMPVTSAAMAAALLALSALPPGLGFASLWLSFQSILLAPRTGGLSSLVPLAFVAGAIALSAALATAASVRLIGIAILGRPRTPQSAGAMESHSSSRLILMALGVVTLLAGMVPGLVLWLLASPAIRVIIGVSSGHSDRVSVLSVSTTSPGYLALPVVALCAVVTAAVLLMPLRTRRQPKVVGPWTDGMEPPSGLPFGEPAAQSTGIGFLPALPAISMPRLPRVPSLPAPSGLSPSVAALWLALTAFAGLLLVLALMP